MADIYPPPEQRLALIKLIEALGCWDRALRRDECGDWAVFGKLGHIYAVPGTLDRPKTNGFQIYFRGAEEFGEPTTARGWIFAKKVLSFCQVTSDGDTEGFLFMDRLPTAAESEIIRDKLGIRKKREISDDERERLRAIGFSPSHVKDGLMAHRRPRRHSPLPQ